ncbi:MAG: hypothetical protein LBD11_07355 [Candidatus Peribacteria bacterium]|jgi:CHASE2 domain-containing sensor protein|nr:hypothetical protein [Candidatus Peribacteria bacterium]
MENVNFWEFVTTNACSAFFTLVFVLGGICRIKSKCSIALKITISVILAVVILAIIFSAGMLHFVDQHPFIYWIELITVVVFTEQLELQNYSKNPQKKDWGEW